ncbi:MAG: signal peptidase I [Candidatus Magasanikbacteria bacterium RIFCSPLOWO2_02_FULL_44_11]|uniref:Signal peptidase I n=2 Tax=Candidatus Magasanikiibacteriota TaxID=1752731 RepID=A0A1F6NAM0_9BACT|nr:MAG: signal peptidase I [Candidatus Magasanikbacteria bacterium RIFCSPHIGHO2_02_FULL_45_10]OGH80901.1 MAG: signal peptidase I [Candidatus Magasanikbacteria bacterium RIFCSPLOWO2_02_FULL_44_11]
MKKGFKIIGYIIGVLIIIRLGYPLLFPVYQVTTDSMEPTIHKGAYIMVSKMHYKIFRPKRNDVVMFKPVDGIFSAGPWAHRIIGISGDVISIQNGVVTVNGTKTFFPEVIHENLEATVKKGYVFQKGDNGKIIVGELLEDKIIGKVIYNFSK